MLLDRLAFDARAGTLVGITAVIEMTDGTDVVTVSECDEWQLAGMHLWACNKVLNETEDDE